MYHTEREAKVEDTLNNSNDLFLTFRKEMEEMSKKTKRLEKENLTLTRKHDLTNRNILEMAEERTKINKDLTTLRKKNVNLESLCRGMQARGRGVSGVAPGSAAAVGDLVEDGGDEEGTESDYEYDDEEEEEEEEGDEDDDEEGSLDDEGGRGEGRGGEEAYDEDTEEDREGEVLRAGMVGPVMGNGTVVVPRSPPPPPTRGLPPPQTQKQEQGPGQKQRQVNGEAVASAVLTNGTTKH